VDEKSFTGGSDTHVIPFDVKLDAEFLKEFVDPIPGMAVPQKNWAEARP